jgi:hypothetical protein
VPGRNTTATAARVVHDARELAHPSLDVEGFALVKFASALVDAYDARRSCATTTRRSRRSCGDFTGARRVLVFDHNVRNTDRDVQEKARTQGAVNYVHNDYTLRSGPQRVRDLVGGDEAERLIERRFAVINVWRPIRGPVQQQPLAFCDASSLAQSDFVATDLRYRDRVGEIYSVTWRARAPLVLLPGMQSDERSCSSATTPTRSARASPPTPRSKIQLSRRRSRAREHRGAHARVLLGATSPHGEESMVLQGYTSFRFTHDGESKTVYRRGAGPGVVIIHEIPGITPPVERFANFVVDAGFTAFVPHLFGTPGKPLSVGYALEQMVRACISREFHVLAAGGSSPVTDWLRALCRTRTPSAAGPGVGAIGMCLTGNFALSLMVDESVMAPVLSQPSLPFPITKRHREGLHLSTRTSRR